MLLVIDLTGVFAFALNGALTAMEAEHLDLVGVVTLGTLTALGGGILRDILIGSLPPATFSDWRYLTVAAASALLAFVTHPLLHGNRWIELFDAAGLSLFCVTGATVALKHGLGPFQAIILGAVTGVGGGTLRDVLIRRVPTVLTSGLYAVPALVGAAVTVLAWELERDSFATALLAAAVCFAIRVAGIRYNLNVPTARPRRVDGEDADTP